MASRAKALMVVSLLAGIVPLPLPVVAATAAAPAEHSQHHCCPKVELSQLAAVTPALPSLPCGADHSCCIVHAPAKLPSLPAGSNGKTDGRLVHAMKVSLSVRCQTLTLLDLRSNPIRSRLDLTAVLRI